MADITINRMENVYGIKKLTVNAENGRTLNQALIYSKNGTFKTSFSRAMYNLSHGEADTIKDRLTDKKAIIDITINYDNGNSEKIYENKFIVFSREIYEKNFESIDIYGQELEKLTADPESKNKLLSIMAKSTSKVKDSLKLKLEHLKLNIDKACNLLVGTTFADLTFNELDKIVNDVDKTVEQDISLIDLKKLFQKTYETIDNPKFKISAENYVDIFNRTLSVELFDENFDYSNCLSFLDSLKQNYFINESKQRGIVLFGEKKYDIEEIEKIFMDAIKKVSENSKVLEANKALIKSMGTSAEAMKLQAKFKNNPMLINQLSLGRKNIILIALKKENFDTQEFKTILAAAKKEYNELIQESIDKKSQFEKAIDIYNNRFNPIFNIHIDNKPDSITGKDLPILSFFHKNCEEKKLSETEIREILSSGEKTALNIISFIVKYEAEKNNNPIIILDDLVETFDYANRHAFVEYIRDMTVNDVSMIILTHNYEFYKNLSKRIPKLEQLSAYSKNGKVTIESSSKLNFNAEKVLDVKKINQLINAIPFLREIQIIRNDDSSLLTSCLHYMQNTKQITIKDIINEFPNTFSLPEENDNYLEVLFKMANNVNVDNTFDIIPKMILSIACRERIESIIINDDFTKLDDIDSNQLNALYEKYKDSLSSKMIKIIDRVQIATPEFIHCNSFMYEPLIDIDGNYLKDLYREICNLTQDDVWEEK